MTNSAYASSIRTATDAAGQSFAVWNENGLLLMARWNSDAVNGRELNLVAAQLAKGGDGREQPVLVASLEAGEGNEADVFVAVGHYQQNGEIQWSDSLRLATPGQQDSNHQLGTVRWMGLDSLGGRQDLAKVLSANLQSVANL